MPTDLASVPDLIELYRATDYQLRMPNGRRQYMRVGSEPPHALKQLMRDDEIAAFMTAWNPFSQPASRQENRKRQRELICALRVVARIILVSAGRGADWHESSLCVIGAPLTALDALARQFRQNAIVVCSRNAQARLRLYREDWRETLAITNGMRESMEFSIPAGAATDA